MPSEYPVPSRQPQRLRRPRVCAEAVALADRVVVISAGKIALDLDVPVERPRRRGLVELARLEGRILDRLFG